MKWKAIFLIAQQISANAQTVSVQFFHTVGMLVKFTVVLFLQERKECERSSFRDVTPKHTHTVWSGLVMTLPVLFSILAMLKHLNRGQIFSKNQILTIGKAKQFLSFFAILMSKG